MPSIHHPRQHPRQLSGIGTAIFGCRQHDRLRLVVAAVGEQYRQLVVAEDLVGSPAV
jgi:hypothetical protein